MSASSTTIMKTRLNKCIVRCLANVSLEASRIAIKKVNVAEGYSLKGLPHELVQFREEARV